MFADIDHVVMHCTLVVQQISVDSMSSYLTAVLHSDQWLHFGGKQLCHFPFASHLSGDKSFMGNTFSPTAVNSFKSDPRLNREAKGSLESCPLF